MDEGKKVNRPLLLDTFCKAGGSSVGYNRAGFDIVGVDIEPQKRYPFEFYEADAIEFILTYGKDFDVITGSPPCQAYSVTSVLSSGLHPMLIPTTRQAMQKIGKPYIIENVKGARLHLDNPIMLCGTMFDELRVIRHRYFECNPVLWWLPGQCQHEGKIGNNSLRDINGKRLINSFENVDILCISGHDFIVEDAKIAMGIDWMIGKELSQAIPPAYTEWLGKEFRKILNI